MRLIDADALKASIVRQCDDCRKLGLDEIAEAIQKGFLQEIDNAPTIEPERNKGKWIETKDSEWSGGGCYKCSHCSLGISFELFGLMPEWNYCPNCGVNMMEEGDHE